MKRLPGLVALVAVWASPTWAQERRAEILQAKGIILRFSRGVPIS